MGSPPANATACFGLNVSLKMSNRNDALCVEGYCSQRAVMGRALAPASAVVRGPKLYPPITKPPEDQRS